MCVYIYVNIYVYINAQSTDDIRHRSAEAEIVNFGAQMQNEAAIFVFEAQGDKLETKSDQQCPFMVTLDVQWVHQNEMLILFGFFPLSPWDCSFVIVCLCCKVHFCFNMRSRTGVCFCFFYSTSIAVSSLYIACLFAAPACFLQQLCSFFSRPLCQTHIYM